MVNYTDTIVVCLLSLFAIVVTILFIVGITLYISISVLKNKYYVTGNITNRKKCLALLSLNSPSPSDWKQLSLDLAKCKIEDLEECPSLPYSFYLAHGKYECFKYYLESDFKDRPIRSMFGAKRVDNGAIGRFELIENTICLINDFLLLELQADKNTMSFPQLKEFVRDISNT